MKKPPHHEAYVPAPGRDEKLRFCVAALEKILEIPGGDEVKEELFRALVWIVSEIDGKFTPRFRSRASLEAPAGTVQHEHVFPMRQLWDIVSKKGMKPEKLVPLITACVVTRDEHRTLSAYDRNPDAKFGWHRYAACKIPVVDMTTGSDVQPGEFQRMNDALDGAFRAIHKE